MNKKLLTALLGTSLIFGIENQIKAQENSYFNEKYKSYFDITMFSSTKTKYKNPLVPSEFYNYIDSWLSDVPKEKRIGFVWINYFDTDNDKFYDYITIQNSTIKNIMTLEKFAFYSNTKEIDYILEIYKRCEKSPIECENIIIKKYEKITPEEANLIGNDFVNRINKIVNSQKEFNRFNTQPIDNLLREEANQWKTKEMDGKYKFDNFGFPIYKYLSEEEINKIEKSISN